MQINLLENPPTADEIASELAAAKARKAHLERSFRWSLWMGSSVLSCVCLIASLTGATAMWMLAVLVGVLLITAGVRGTWSFSDEPTENERVFDPVRSPFYISRVVEACALDPRVDAYRRRVIAQGREMTVLEASACSYWLDYGYRNDRTFAAYRSEEPITVEQARALTLEGDA